MYAYLCLDEVHLVVAEHCPRHRDGLAVEAVLQRSARRAACRVRAGLAWDTI